MIFTSSAAATTTRCAEGTRAACVHVCAASLTLFVRAPPLPFVPFAACAAGQQLSECPERAAHKDTLEEAAGAGDEDVVTSSDAVSVITLVAQCVPDDTVLYCLPMLAPYTALAKVPYKVRTLVSLAHTIPCACEHLHTECRVLLCRS